MPRQDCPVPPRDCPVLPGVPGSVRRVLQKERAKESPVNSSRQTKKDRRESMAPKKTNAKTSDWKSELLAGGDVVRELFREVLQEVLEAEMTETLQAKPGERTAERQGLRSGYNSRTLITRVGKLELRVPQDRQGRFSTQLFERYQRSEKALVSALAEMYVQGVTPEPSRFA